jgi:hypothetical protein
MFHPPMAIFREVVNKTKSSYIILLYLEYVGENRSEFILGKNKLKLFCCGRNVQYKMPHGTQDCNGCHYPLSYMDLLCKDNRRTKYFYFTERSILLLTISALNTDCYINQNYYKHIYIYISHCAYNNHVY